MDKKKSMRKTVNFLILNMAMSDLIHPIFIFPPTVMELQGDFKVVSGVLDQAFCNLVFIFQLVSNAVSIVTKMSS